MPHRGIEPASVLRLAFLSVRLFTKWAMRLCCLVQVHVQCCFTSTETPRTIRDGEHREATSTVK